MQKTEIEETEIMLGNEAVAIGLLDGGARYFAAYPGTPSTEIVEKAMIVKDEFQAIVHWSTNEAIAMEEAAAAATTGEFAVFAAKHVGLNVAADPLMTLAYLGITGALVVCVSDDIGIHSSQNEQDSRWYARLAHIPIFEPTDPENAYLLARESLKLSHLIERPVILRLTTRISHALSAITRQARLIKPEIPSQLETKRFVIMPNKARIYKRLLNQALELAKETASKEKFYLSTNAGNSLGVVSTGAAASYIPETYADEKNFDFFIPYITYPLPEDAIIEFLKNHSTILIAEEAESILEQDIKLIAYNNNLQCKIHGKDLLPLDYELTTSLITNAIRKLLYLDEIVHNPIPQNDNLDLLDRPPVFCAGCPHRSSYYSLTRALRHKETIYCNDIGCYTLGFLPPFNAADSLVCMGASIGMGIGYASLNPNKVVVSIIGDSTFWHTGISALANAIWMRVNLLVVILDNGITAMTGMQENPSTHDDLNIAKTVDAMGAQTWVIDAFDEKGFRRLVKEVIENTGVKVIVSRGSCVINEYQQKQIRGETWDTIIEVDSDKCNMCGICYEKLNCNAFLVVSETLIVDENSCNGCSVCISVCPRKALILKEI